MVKRYLLKDGLKNYGVFSETTITHIADFADKLKKFKSYKAFFKACNIPEPRLFVNAKGEGVTVVDIAARKTEKGTIVLHLPMANPLDANQLYHVAVVVATNPQYRVIVFGNPSGAPFNYKEQNLSFWKRFGIGTLLNLYPLISAESSYLREHGITAIHHVGYSYGAHKALIATHYTRPEFMRSLTLIDPVAHPRGAKQLIEDFQRTFQPLGNYVNRTETDSYFEARKIAAETKHHKPALKRQINIAIGFMMARLDFIPLLKKTVTQQPSLQVAVAWGSKSELTNDAHLTTSLNQLAHNHPGKITSLRLKDDVHAFANDIYLYAAIIRESLSKTKT